MAARHHAETDIPHALLHKPVRDIASGTEGTLMAVRVENVTAADGPGARWAEIAYIRPAGGGRELTTAVKNIEPR
ncbi:hypothetical protein [Streptomyces sp. NPDC047014]|uniref:hypothetical protein n=1 Tax=Streptomyces sp. NPDC047014 TaxID=3155736 RepID=UPI0033C72213